MRSQIFPIIAIAAFSFSISIRVIPMITWGVFLYGSGVDQYHHYFLTNILYTFRHYERRPTGFTSNYPIGFHLLIAQFSYVTGLPLMITFNVFCGIIISFYSLTIFILVKQVWNSEFAASLAAVFICLSGGVQAMWSFGSLPNLLSVFLTMLFWFTSFSGWKKGNQRYFIISTTLLTMMFLTYFPFWAVFVMILYVFFRSIHLKRFEKEKIEHLFTIFFFSSVFSYFAAKRARVSPPLFEFLFKYAMNLLLQVQAGNKTALEPAEAINYINFWTLQFLNFEGILYLIYAIIGFGLVFVYYLTKQNRDAIAIMAIGVPFLLFLGFFVFTAYLGALIQLPLTLNFHRTLMSFSPFLSIFVGITFEFIYQKLQILSKVDFGKINLQKSIFLFLFGSILFPTTVYPLTHSYVYNTTFGGSQYNQSRMDNELYHASLWITENTKSNSRMVVFYPFMATSSEVSLGYSNYLILYVFTLRRISTHQLQQDDSITKDYLENKGLIEFEYFIYNQKIGHIVFSDDFQLVYSSRNMKIYQL